MRPLLPGLLAAMFACDGSTTVIDAPGGGDGSSAAPDGVRSGTRLKINWLDFEGTKYWQNLHDSLRRENCYVTELGGGQLVCMPGETAYVVFGDAGCTQRLGQVYRDPSGCIRTPPAYLLEYSSNGCYSRPERLFQRGTQVATTQYYLKSGTTCGGPYATTNYDYYAPGAEVPMSELVPITVSAPTVGGRLVKATYESVDGMRMPARIRDTTLDTDCFASGTTSGATSATCTPSQTSYASYFNNAACTLAEASTSTTCATPKFLRNNPTGCPNSDRYYVAGAQVTAPPLYYSSGTTCSTVTPPTEARFFVAGAPITLPTMMRSPDPGTARIRPIHFALDSGPHRDYALYDSMKLAECSPFTLPDGTTRCLPSGGGSVQTMYTDAQCTNAIEILDIYRGAATCTAPPAPPFALKYLPSQSGMTCGSNYTVHSIGAPYTGALYRKLSTSCSLYTATTTLLYRASAAIPLDQFALGTKSTDP